MPRHGRSASRPGPGRSGPVRPAFGPGVPLRPSSTRRRQDGAKAQVTRILRPLSCPAQAPTGRPSPGSLPQGSTSPYSTATSRAASPASARSSAASLTAGPGSAWLSDRTRPASCSACSQPSSTARLGGRGQLSLVVDSTCGVHHGAGRPHLDRSGVTPWRRARDRQVRQEPELLSLHREPLTGSPGNTDSRHSGFALHRIMSLASRLHMEGSYR